MDGGGRGVSPEKQSLVLGCGDWPLAPVESVGLCLAEPQAGGWVGRGAPAAFGRGSQDLPPAGDQ